MKLFLHDLPEDDFERLLPNPPAGCKIISDDGSIHPCPGCFGCWIKTPGACVIRNRYGDMGELLSQSDAVTVVSRCFYGGFSPFVKNVIDRSIPYLHPYFTVRGGEMHHRHRYDNIFDLSVYFYGNDISADEKRTAEKLVGTNAKNFDCSVRGVSFFRDAAEMEGRIL